MQVQRSDYIAWGLAIPISVLLGLIFGVGAVPFAVLITMILVLVGRALT